MEVLASLGSDVIVLTEGCAELLPHGGFVIDAGPDWGYRVEDPTRRKVLVWSKQPWSEVDSFGADSLPSGRFVAGTTPTPLGDVRVFGVCVPWRGAHVTHGRRDRRAWEEHTLFLEGFAALLGSAHGPTVIAGDLNQRIPRAAQPVAVAQQLAHTLTGFEVPTAAVREPQPIDHIAHSRDLVAVGPPGLIASSMDGVELSDHTGVHVELVPSPHP